jgi:hypothetical protein
MRIKTVTIYCLFFLLFCQSIALSKALASEKNNVKDFTYYIDKGNRREQLTIEEFRLLMQELKNKLMEVKTAFSKISVWGADLFYEVGKAWEIQLDITRKDVENALKILSAVREKPNSISLSVGFYICIVHINNSALAFENLDHFAKIIKTSGLHLRLWTIAFEKAHLAFLAISKDKGSDLYVHKQ